MDNNSIKENIRRIRKIRGYTQHELATRCGISMTHYRSIEVGTTAIINPIVLRISKVLDIGIGYLLLGSWNWKDQDFALEDEAVGYGFNGGFMDKANRRYNDMRDDYEARLSKLREEILTLRQVVDSQRRDISHLESVVRMMRRIKGIE